MQLRENLKNLASDPSFRLAILGIGNELNGDDSAGVVVAQKLLKRLKIQPNLLVMNCGSIPENATGALRRFHPDLVMMIDAADMGDPPGTIRVLEPQEISGFSASSHTLPLTVLTKYLQQEFSTKAHLCCIQPLTLEFDTGLSSPVKKSINQIVTELVTLQKGWNIAKGKEQ